ncbi:MAG: hypothetical protein QM831_21790 [Kofleriaceae bacterium]
MRLVGCLVLFAACSSTSPSDYEGQLRDANCAQLVRCNEFPDVTSCQQFFVVNDASFEAEIAAGTINFDSDKANECINAIKNAPCDLTAKESRVTPDACTQAVSGTLEDNTDCYSNESCKSGTCIAQSCPDACCVGQCRAESPPANMGEPCATRACAEGLTCDNTKTCVPLYTAGTTCIDSTDCEYGLACVGSPGTCQDIPHTGEACTDICGDLGTHCAGTCVADGLAGAACTTNADCSPFYPCDTTSGQCTALPTAGQACTGLCSDTSYCDSTSKTCTPRQANGATCTAAAQCESNFCKTTCQDPPECG